MILYLKIDNVHVSYIKLKDVQVHVLDTLRRRNIKKLLRMLLNLFSGKSRKIQKNLSDQMEKASDNLDFEKAVILRDKNKIFKHYSIISKN